MAWRSIGEIEFAERLDLECGEGKRRVKDVVLVLAQISGWLAVYHLLKEKY